MLAGPVGRREEGGGRMEEEKEEEEEEEEEEEGGSMMCISWTFFLLSGLKSIDGIHSFED